MFRQVREANSALDVGDAEVAAGAAASVMEIVTALGLELRAETGSIPAEIQALADQRTAAREAEDYATADELEGSAGRRRLDRRGRTGRPGGPADPLTGAGMGVAHRDETADRVRENRRW